MPMQEKKRKTFEHTSETLKIKDAIKATNYLLTKIAFKIAMYWSRDAVALCKMEPEEGKKPSWNQASGAWVIVVKIHFDLSRVGASAIIS